MNEELQLLKEELKATQDELAKVKELLQKQIEDTIIAVKRLIDERK